MFIFNVSELECRGSAVRPFPCPWLPVVENSGPADPPDCLQDSPIAFKSPQLLAAAELSSEGTVPQPPLLLQSQETFLPFQAFGDL